MYHLLHGEDEFSRSEHVSRLRSAMGDPQFADLNTATFDGRKVSLGELAHACDAMPFLAEKRLVIVEGMLTRLEPHRKKADDDSGEAPEIEVDPDLARGLKEYLTRVPEFTDLVFVEPKTLAKNNPFLKQAEGDKKKAKVHLFPVPDERDLPDWIRSRVSGKGGKIEPAAVQELAAHVGADLRLLDNEIDKVLAYCGTESIRTEDVRTLVASVRESNIFELVDAIGARQTSSAMRLLHAQLDQNAAPLYLLAMITRQFRMLLQIQDLRTRGMNPAAIREKLRLHPFVIDKTSKQAQNFTVPQLQAIYRKLLDTDLAMKTSRRDPVVALDMLVVDLTFRS